MNLHHARRSSPILFLFLIFGQGFGPVEAGADDSPAKKVNPAVQAAAAMYEGIRTETLPNGLRVYLKPVPGSPVVTTMVAYKVGSADEDLDHTGLSHYLEHLMFKGTDKIMPGDIDRMTLRNGGANNAYTSEDYTVFHFDFASDLWDKALEIEADRMRNLRIDDRHEFEKEKGAVIQELQKDEDQPWDLESKAIVPLLFGRTAPYGHPIIGEREHVRGATAAIIKAHYDKWYHPNNAALVVCGGFDPDKALARIKQLFGPIPAAKLPPRKPALEVIRKSPVHHEFDSKFELPRLLMGFNTVRTGEPDSYPLEIVQALLTGGKTGRLYQKLVEGEEVASEVSAGNNTGRYPGSFMIQVQLLKSVDRPKIEALVLEELKKLADQPVSEAELHRAKQGILSSAIFGRESVHNLADSIARGVTTTDLDYLRTYLPRIDAVTAKQVREVARKYFDPQGRVVVWSVPKEGAATEKGEEKKDDQKENQVKDRFYYIKRGIELLAENERRNRKAPAESEDAEMLARKFFQLGQAEGQPGKQTSGKGQPRNPARGAHSVEGSGEFSLKNVQRVVLDNGLTLLLFENHRLPIVVAEAYVGKARLLEPADQAGVAALTGMLLDEGTAKHTGPEISELIENVGGSLSLSESGGSVKVLSPDRGLGLDLLFDCLARARFPKEAFTRKQRQLLASIEDVEKQPDAKAQMVYRELTYAKHPYGRPSMGRVETVKALTPEACAAFHRRLFVPNNTIVAIVGDFDSKQVIEEVTRLTADWKKTPLDIAKPQAVEKPKEFTQKILTMPDAAQLHFFMGHVGVRRADPDFYKLLVMDYILGTGPGFTDRLSAQLRDREGLAYTVSANVTDSATEEPGLFTCYIGTDPGHFNHVRDRFLQELMRIRKEKPQPDEVEDAKKYLLGSLPFQFTTNGRIASQLVAIERYHLGLDYLDEYRKAVAAVTADDVLAVARKYLDPEHLVLVAAGAIGQDGKPLGK